MLYKVHKETKIYDEFTKFIQSLKQGPQERNVLAEHDNQDPTKARNAVIHMKTWSSNKIPLHNLSWIR